MLRLRTVAFAGLFCFRCVSSAFAAAPMPADFAAIQTAPAERQGLEEEVVEKHDGDGEGEELPSSMLYYPSGSADFATSMTVTDSSLCRRPAERAICQAFAKMISAPPPALGADVTETRIGGAGYRTVFLTRIDGVVFDGVASSTAFLGGDSQDPPQSTIVVYVYAKRGSNLIQLTAPVGPCDAPVKPNESDVAYYRRACVGDTVLAKAASVGKQLVHLFRLQR